MSTAKEIQRYDLINGRGEYFGLNIPEFKGSDIKAKIYFNDSKVGIFQDFNTHPQARAFVKNLIQCDSSRLSAIFDSAFSRIMRVQEGGFGALNKFSAHPDRIMDLISFLKSPKDLHMYLSSRDSEGNCPNILTLSYLRPNPEWYQQVTHISLVFPKRAESRPNYGKNDVTPRDKKLQIKQTLEAHALISD